MQGQLENFCYKQTLNINFTEKITYVLGSILQKEAILVLTAKPMTAESFDFKNIIKIFQNDIYSRFTADLLNNFDVQMIHPITEKHKKKYMKKDSIIKRQSGDQYKKGRQQLIQKELKHIDWVYNIIEGKSQAERILFKGVNFVILPDLKYSDLSNKDLLHLTVIFTHKQLNSIRDLNQSNLPLLQETSEAINKVLHDKFVLKPQNCRMYFHYPPTFYQLHLHIMSLNLESLSCKVQRCHELSTVIQNIGLKSDYYQCVTLNTFESF